MIFARLRDYVDEPLFRQKAFVAFHQAGHGDHVEHAERSVSAAYI